MGVCELLKTQNMRTKRKDVTSEFLDHNHKPISRVKLTEKQIKLVEIIKDKNTKVVFLKGVAGSAKTFTSMYVGLDLLLSNKIDKMVLVRSIVESSSNLMGYLPGGQEEKFAPYNGPFADKFGDLTTSDELKTLHKEHRIVEMPVNFLRGREFKDSYIIVDEAQNLTLKEILTTITRIGKGSKMIFCGDTEQCDLRNNGSGFLPFYRHFDKPEAAEKGIHCFKFGIEDIMREEIIGYLVEEFGKLKATLEKK